MSHWQRTAGLLIVLTAFLGCALADERPAPRLILQITVDALRADLLLRYAHVFGPDGFRRLLDKGIYYTQARYRHANTETIVGHVSLATGTTPAIHGMVSNVWFERTKNRLFYNIEDAEYRLLTANAGVDEKTEIDVTQKTARTEGRSPRNILVSTFADELAQKTQGKGKIFAVSIKDRGAVSMAGHAGKAFWFSKATGRFVTSNYYYARYPSWVEAWNRRRLPYAYAGQAWRLLLPKAQYHFARQDAQPFETDFPGFGRSFPHAYGRADDPYFTTRLTLSPAGDALTLDFAKTLIEQEALGSDPITDYLAISFSSTDYVGHLFGASSLEIEDTLARLDRLVAELVDTVDEQVGLAHTLIVLSADHGQPEVPGYLHTLGIQNAHYFDWTAFESGVLQPALRKRFGLRQAESLIQTYHHPYLYLNHRLIGEYGLNQTEVENAVVQQLMAYPGIAQAISTSALQRGEGKGFAHASAVLNNYHPKRSGEIHVVFEPDVFLNDFDGLHVASTHGSPWRYDTDVPIVFFGWRLGAERIAREVTPYDIAPTLSAVVGAKPPSGATGHPLKVVVEALQGKPIRNVSK